MVPEKKFPPIEKTTKIIRELESEEYNLTKLLKMMSSYSIATRALGGLLLQLKRYELEHEVIRTAKFEEYVPSCCIDMDKIKHTDPQRRMVLDSMTLVNLDIISENENGQGTVLKQINKCTSSGGKRMMQFLVTSPPSNLGIVPNTN